MSSNLHEPSTDNAVLPLESQASGSDSGTVYAASAFSLVAALIHLWVTPEHFEEWWAYGTFFLAVAFAQGLFCVVFPRSPGQLLAFVGVWGNLAVILVYVLSRTSGLPVGPHAGEIEDAGVLDMAATVSELATVILLVSVLRGSYRAFAVNALLLLGLAIWSLRLAGIL